MIGVSDTSEPSLLVIKQPARASRGGLLESQSTTA